MTMIREEDPLSALWGWCATHLTVQAGAAASGAHPLPAPYEAQAQEIAHDVAAYDLNSWCVVGAKAKSLTAVAVAAFEASVPLVENFRADDPAQGEWSEADEPLVDAEMHGRSAAKAMRVLYLAELIRNGAA